MRGRSRSLVLALFLVLAVAWIAGQWTAIRTENINWDEFAFLSRVRASLDTGTLASGGRPGLAVLFLIPFARGCTNSVDAIVSARLLWLGFTVAYLVGILVFVIAGSSDRKAAWPGAMMAVALVAAVPVFMRWSLQVRTDQPAAMFALWGGACLLASQRRSVLAAAAGLLFALAFLCTQKAAYIGALTAVVFAVRTMRDLDVNAVAWKRALTALAFGVSGFLATLGVYYFLLSLFFNTPGTMTLERGLNTFAFYRRAFGYAAYRAMRPTLAAHGLLIACALVALVVSGRRTLRHRTELIAAWIVLLVGYGVGLFHAAAFPYFWITLGLFPAIAIGIAWSGLLEVFASPWSRALLWLTVPLLAATAVQGTVAIHRDTQRVQRDSLAFIDRNFSSAARGFQAEGALVCRMDPKPFPTYFAENARLLAGPAGRARADALIQEFRTRPVEFMIAHRLFPFPDPVQPFWDLHYVVYRNEVMVPGAHVRGKRGDSIGFGVIVPGRYRWLPEKPAGARLSQSARTLASGDAIDLTAGTQLFSLLDDVGSGMLVLALKDGPAPNGPEFYAPEALRELDPFYPRFLPNPTRYLPTVTSPGGEMR